MAQVNVIIPTYDRADFLRASITSVLNQTFQDFEIIVVDDGSKDNTQEVINSFHDKRIKSIRHTVNKGEASARNTGIKNSNAEYIAFLDDDDEWFPEKLNLQVGVLKNNHPKIGAVYTGFLAIDASSKKNTKANDTRKKRKHLSRHIYRKLYWNTIHSHFKENML